MKQEPLFKISLIISIAGIFLLLFLTNFLELKLTKINEINDKMLNEKVKISGEIEKIEDKETFKILSIKDETGIIDALCECANISSSQNVEVIGKIQDYKGTLQIQVDKLLTTSLIKKS